ncbi:unnamed protein product [Notodromas monacha]|uniref:Major facilitator superfamily associated domain-containing protein n=1 Tax=Notodromas monacha TaxID=399045 RepID=A0A7R9GBD5_9CRUS|nr:unnamed protein product [Notodromas monacha]CAG0914709.1 unnamed protein product [Notodromas monacha]
MAVTKRPIGNLDTAAQVQQQDQQQQQQKSEKRRLFRQTDEHWICFNTLEVNKNLLPLKFMMFCFYGAMAALLPYLTIHMQALGLTIEEIAVIYAVLPFTSFLGAPITGFIADKFGNYRAVLALCIASTALFHTALLLVPRRDFSMAASSTSPLSAGSFHCLPEGTKGLLTLDANNNNSYCTSESLDKICWPSSPGQECLSISNISDAQLLLSFQMPISKEESSTNATLTVNNKPFELKSQMLRDDQGNYASDIDGATCDCDTHCTVVLEKGCEHHQHMMMMAAATLNGKGDKISVTFWSYFLLRVLGTLFMGAAFSLLDATALAIVAKHGKEYGKQRVWAIVAMAVLSPITGVLVDAAMSAKHQDGAGGDNDKASGFAASFYMCDAMSALNLIGLFLLDFQVEAGDEDDNTSGVKQTHFQKLRRILGVVEAAVFLFMMLILGAVWGFIEVLGTLFMGAAFSLLDATALAIVAKHGKEYGKQRVWAIVAMAVLSPITGVLVDAAMSAKHQDGAGGDNDKASGFAASFYMCDAMSALNLIGLFLLDFQVEAGDEDDNTSGVKQTHFQKLRRILGVVEAAVFLFMMLILGAVWGFIESYLFVYLVQELGAPNYLLGMTLTVGSLVGIPFLYGAEKVVAVLGGRVHVIVLAFLVYCARSVGYSYIPNAWWCFPFEAMEAFTYHLMWVAAATYVPVLAPAGLLATMTGIMASMHFSVGKGLGSFVGGYTISAVGMRQTFRAAGILSAIVGLLYLALQHLYLKQRIAKRLEKQGSILQPVRTTEDVLASSEVAEEMMTAPVIIDDEFVGRVAYAPHHHHQQEQDEENQQHQNDDTHNNKQNSQNE